MTQITESQPKNSLHALREALEQAERQIGRLDRSNIKAFLIGLDRLEQMFAAHDQTEDPVGAEAVRWESLRQRISANPGPLVAAAADAGGLTKLRSQYAVAAGSWWYLDAELARHRARTMKRIGMALVAVVVVVLIVWGGSAFFPALFSPSAGSLPDTTSDIEQLVATQKWSAALTAVAKARQAQPAAAELLAWEAVLNEQVGNPTQAHSSLAEAQQHFVGQPAAFWILVGTLRQQTGNLSGAEEAGQQALTAAPQNADATFLLGSVAEARGDTVLAATYFSQTIALAGNKNPQLGVVAKVRMGNLIQHIEPLPNPAPPQTITQTVTPSS